MSIFSARATSIVLTALAFGCAATTDVGDGDLLGTGGTGAGGLYGAGGGLPGAGGAVLGAGGGVLGAGGGVSSGGTFGSGGYQETGGAVGVGGTLVGSGGAPAAGGAAAAGGAVGTGGSNGVCTLTSGTGSFTRDIDYGRFVSGNGAGYAFAYVSPFTGGTATDCGSPSATATGICASGTVPAQAAYTAVAGIAWNVNQPGGVGTAAGVYASTVTSVGVSYANNTASVLRVQASTSSGDYCYTLPAGTSVTLTPAQFNSKCWDATGTAWNGVGLKSIQLITPSSNTTTTPFNACLNGVTLAP